VLQDFIRTWTSEEDQHGNVLNTYLLLTRNSDPDRLHQLRKTVIRTGWEPPTASPFQAMVYTAIQELATKVYYLNLARVADIEDPALAHILRSITKDETLHYAFYRDAVKAHLEVNPNYVEPLVEVMLGFVMPGHAMPNIEERVRLTELNGIYTLHDYYSQVLETVIKVWDIGTLKPDALAAKEALDRLNHHMRRLARLASFSERRRKEADPEISYAAEMIAAGWHGPM
jgi:acyl-[acyl-carrier-protein] desaturase